MALTGIATGALVTAPVVALITWFAISWQQHVDVRVERDTVAARADRAAFSGKFDDDWAAATGRPVASCDPATARELARLRARTAELETKLTGSRAGIEHGARELEHVITGAK